MKQFFYASGKDAPVPLIKAIRSHDYFVEVVHEMKAVQQEGVV